MLKTYEMSEKGNACMVVRSSNQIKQIRDWWSVWQRRCDHIWVDCSGRKHDQLDVKSALGIGLS